TKRAVCAFDHLRDNGRIERLRVDTGTLEQRGRRSPECGCETERLARRRRKAGEARAQEPLERLRDGKRLRQVDLEAQGAREPERARIDSIRRRVLDQKRAFERTPTRPRQPRQHLVEDTLEQIADPDVREAPLRLSWSRSKNRPFLRTRVVDPREPERRLAD